MAREGMAFLASAARRALLPVKGPVRQLCARSAVQQLAPASTAVRNDWTRAEVAEVYNMPFQELLFQAAQVHRESFDPLEVQRCTLLSVKTGGCTEDCKYCAQSSRYSTEVSSEPMMPVMNVLEAAHRAKQAGSTRFCMGTAWRELGGKKAMFKKILSMVREVKKLDMEVCCTLGMLTEEQALQLKEAGLSAYNHNLDTSREHYSNVITTRSYDDRLQTIANVRKVVTSCHRCSRHRTVGPPRSPPPALLRPLPPIAHPPGPRLGVHLSRSVALRVLSGWHICLLWRHPWVGRIRRRSHRPADGARYHGNTPGVGSDQRARPCQGDTIRRERAA